MFQHTSTRHCRCSTRAFESLIFDLAGLRLSSSKQRWATSNFANRQCSITTGNIPSKRTFASQRMSSAKDSFQTPKRKQDRPPSLRGKLTTNSAKSWTQTKSKGGERSGYTKRHKTTKAEAAKTIVEPGRSAEKNLSRLLRKQRRIEAGKFKTGSEPGSLKPDEATSEAVSEGMRSRIQEKVEAASHEVEQKSAGPTESKQSAVASREDENSGRLTANAQGDANVASAVVQDIDTKEVHDEGVDGNVTVHEELSAEEAIDGVSESHESVLKRIEGLSGSNEDFFKTPSLLFGMEGDMANPNKKFAKDNPPAPYKPKDKEAWQVQKAALQEKFGSSGWDPRKRLSPDTLNGIRALHASDPGTYSTEVLANNFKVSPDAIRRILKSKWRPSEDEARDRLERWERRGARKWQEMATEGMRPPRRWRAMGIQQRGVAESRLRRSRRLPEVRERNGPGGVRVPKHMEGVITQRASRHGRVLSAASTLPAAPGGARSNLVKEGFAGRIL